MTGLLIVCKWQPHVSYNRHLVSLLTECLLCAQQGIGTYWYAHPFSCKGQRVGQPTYAGQVLEGGYLR